MAESRSRLTIACETCRKRKRKCDGVTPVCSWCFSNSKECLYIIERPKKRKWDTDYLSHLEDQIALLKDYTRGLESLNPTATRPPLISSILEETVHPGRDGSEDDEQERTIGSLVPADDAQVQHTRHFLSTADVSAVDDVSSMMWRMTIGDDGETSFTGPSGNFFFPTQSSDILDKRTVEPQYHQARGLLIVSKLSKELRSALLDLFIRFTNPIHQFLDSESLAKLTAPELSKQSEVLYGAVLATGSLYSEDPYAQAIGEQIVAELESVILDQRRYCPNVSTVQVLTLLCWRELSLEHENMSWMYNSMAASLCLHLGLHVSQLENLEETPARHEISAVLSETRNSRVKAFWAYLFVDRLATVLLGRNCMIHWSRVRASTFLTAVDCNATLEEIVFDAHTRFWFIHDQFMDSIYSFGFRNLDDASRYKLLLEARDGLSSFYRQLSPALQLHKAQTSKSVLILHMSYYMSHILVHRPYLQEPPDSQPYQLSVRSMSTAAGSMVRLLREFQEFHSFDKSPPLLVHHVLTAAVTLLLNATSTNSSLRSQSVARFRVCFGALEATQRRWPRAKKAVNLLRYLASRWNIQSSLPMKHGFAPLSTEPVQIICEEVTRNEPVLVLSDDNMELGQELAMEVELLAVESAQYNVDGTSTGFGFHTQDLEDFASLFTLDSEWISNQPQNYEGF